MEEPSSLDSELGPGLSGEAGSPLRPGPGVGGQPSSRVHARKLRTCCVRDSSFCMSWATTSRGLRELSVS